LTSPFVLFDSPRGLAGAPSSDGFDAVKKARFESEVDQDDNDMGGMDQRLVRFAERLDDWRREVVKQLLIHATHVVVVLIDLRQTSTPARSAPVPQRTLLRPTSLPTRPPTRSSQS
jgi:hypothetical protein